MDHEASPRAIDRRLDSISKLLHTGMKILAEQQYRINALIDSQVRADQRLTQLAEAQQSAQQRTDQKFAELAEAQKATEAALQAFLRRSGNGHE